MTNEQFHKCIAVVSDKIQEMRKIPGNENKNGYIVLSEQEYPIFKSHLLNSRCDSIGFAVVADKHYITYQGLLLSSHPRLKGYEVIVTTESDDKMFNNPVLIEEQI